MAESWGNSISTSSGNYWQVGVNAYVTSTTDEYVYIHVDAKVYTRWPFNVYANGSAGSTNDETRYWSGSLNQGNGATTTYISYDTYFMRYYGQDRTVQVWAQYNVTGGYGNGTSNASVSLSIPARPYSTPRPPKNATVTSNSDASQTVSWGTDYTGSDDAYPWSSVSIARLTDGTGDWAQLGTVSWDVTSFTDTTTSANHKYLYNVWSNNPAGSSTHVSAGDVRTTPAAPSSVSVARNSDTSCTVKVWAGRNASNSATSTLVRVSVDNGPYVDVSSQSSLSPSVNYTTAVGHKYVFAARHSNSKYSSGWVYTSAYYTTPQAPTNAAATYKSDTSVLVKWANPSTASVSWGGARILRSVDGGSFAQIATVGNSVTNYTDTSTSAGHSYAYQVVAYTPTGLTAYAQTGTVYTTPTAPTSVSAISTGATSVSVAATGSSAYVDGYQFEHRVGADGEWGETVTQSSETAHMASAAGDNWYRARAYKGTLYSAWTATTGSIVTMAQPLAPSVSVPSLAPSGTSVTVSWTPNHPDGSAISASQVEVTDPSGTVSTTGVTGTAISTTVTVSSKGTYSFRVRTKGLWAESNDGWGLWSDSSVTNVYDLPSVEVTSGDSVDRMPFTVTWSATDETGITAQSVTITDANGTALFSANPATGVSSVTVTTDDMLPENGATYTVSVTVRGGSSFTNSASKAFTVAWTSPNAPIAEVLTNTDALYEVVTVKSGDATGSVTTSYFTVERINPDGTTVMLDASVSSGQTLNDYLVPLNVDFAYRVTAVSDSGASFSRDYKAFVASDGSEAFNFGSDGGTCVRLAYDAKASASVTHSGESYHFALGPNTPSLPTFYPDGNTDISGSRSYVLYGSSDYTRLRSIVRDHRSAMCWLRDFYGGVHRVYAKFTLGYEAGTYDQFSVSADVTETVWEEPVRG